ncbi:hypothetical protein [Serratia fonticola]
MSKYISSRIEPLRELFNKPIVFPGKQSALVTVAVPEDMADLCRFVAKNPGLISMLIGYYDTATMMQEQKA